ncbi:type II toxin-antitoxin system RnlB family antitoxin [Bacteroides neonati]|uniref:type II toxin-antitoxin system RnlB family antitoxin n=1 Tax=Bacteroides neonati TaxID=1347393 RepID=UPI0005A9212A
MRTSDYILKKTADNKYSYLLLTTSMSRLDDYIYDVEIELLSKKVSEGFIIFDLLLNNNIQDRFYQCFFNGKRFEINKLTKIDSKEINIKIIRTSSCFYVKNMDLFDSLFFTNDFKVDLRKKLIELL